MGVCIVADELKMDVREKLVALLQDANNPVWSWFPNNMAMMQLADYLIANGVTVQEWIPVTERLPENDAMVIGYTPCDGFMFVGYYHEENKYDWRQWYIVTAMRSTKVITKKVTHWMPLPEPPKEE